MSCDECDRIQDIAFNKNINETIGIAYYRIDVANIAIVGCKKHIKLTIEKLREAYKLKDKIEELTSEIMEMGENEDEASGN